MKKQMGEVAVVIVSLVLAFAPLKTHAENPPSITEPTAPKISVTTQKQIEPVATAETNIETEPTPEIETTPTVEQTPTQTQTYTAPLLSVSEADAKAFIYQHESGNRTDAINASSGACGLGQALPCSKMGCSLSDYGCQDAFFTDYAYSRYGSWGAAYNFWQVHSWW